MPSSSAAPGRRRPAGNGRFIVRCMTLSMSRSYHMLMAPEAPAPSAMQAMATRPTTESIVAGASSMPTSAGEHDQRHHPRLQQDGVVAEVEARLRRAPRRLARRRPWRCRNEWWSLPPPQRRGRVCLSGSGDYHRELARAANYPHPRARSKAAATVQTNRMPPITATRPPRPFKPMPIIGARSISPCASPATLRGAPWPPATNRPMQAASCPQANRWRISRCRRRLPIGPAEQRQEAAEEQAEERQGDAGDDAVIVRGRARIGAVDEQPERAAHGEQQHRQRQRQERRLVPRPGPADAAEQRRRPDRRRRAQNVLQPGEGLRLLRRERRETGSRTAGAGERAEQQQRARERPARACGRRSTNGAASRPQAATSSSVLTNCRTWPPPHISASLKSCENGAPASARSARPKQSERQQVDEGGRGDRRGDAVAAQARRPRRRPAGAGRRSRSMPPAGRGRRSRAGR